MAKQIVSIIANCEVNAYLTKGKEYEVIRVNSSFGKDANVTIIADDGTEISTMLNRSAHLNGKSWKVKRSRI